MPDAQTYERQAAKTDLPTAQFVDVHHHYDDWRAVWRPPNEAELAKLDVWAAVTPGVPSIDSAHVAVIDGYQDPTPGYAGPLAVLVFTHMDEGTGVRTLALADLNDPRETIEDISQLRDSGATPAEAVEELGLAGDTDAVNAIEAELSDLDPVGYGDRVNYFGRVADEIEAGADQ